MADATVNIPSMTTAHLNRKMRSSNLQQNKTKTGNSRISLKLPEIHQNAEISSERNEVEQNDAALGQPTTQEGGTDTTPGDGSELESD